MRSTDGVPLVTLRRLEAALTTDRADLRLLAREPSRHYRSFAEPKPNGGSREIDDPSPLLKRVQRLIATSLLTRVALPAYVLGGVRGRSIRDNARIHKGQSCVLRVDIKAYFPTVGPRAVYRVFHQLMAAPPSVASLLTKLTTYKHRLPQGAPTSPRLATLASLDLFTDLHTLATEAGCKFSVWCDDLFFSGDRDQITALVLPVVALIRGHGFAVSPRKIDVMHRGRRQLITGVVINDGISAGRSRYVAELRERVRRYWKTTSQEELDPRLRGQLQYVGSLSPVQAAAVKRLARSNELRRERHIKHQ